MSEREERQEKNQNNNNNNKQQNVTNNSTNGFEWKLGYLIQCTSFYCIYLTMCTVKKI